MCVCLCVDFSAIRFEMKNANKQHEMKTNFYVGEIDEECGFNHTKLYSPTHTHTHLLEVQSTNSSFRPIENFSIVFLNIAYSPLIDLPVI